MRGIPKLLVGEMLVVWEEDYSPSGEVVLRVAVPWLLVAVKVML